MPAIEPCAVCGLPLAIGEQGCITTIRPHDPVLTYHPFIPRFDVALGAYTGSLAERWKHMRRAKVDYREHPPKGELSARRDRLEQQKRDTHG